ncbi:MAG: hypothetical protein LBP62_04000 [Clostridiales bacterium]|jgi:hypothetical protein|nr:hypothetical protein [Clostridiales bacterium]
MREVSPHPFIPSHGGECKKRELLRGMKNPYKRLEMIVLLDKKPYKRLEMIVLLDKKTV